MISARKALALSLALTLTALSPGGGFYQIFAAEVAAPQVGTPVGAGMVLVPAAGMVPAAGSFIQGGQAENAPTLQSSLGDPETLEPDRTSAPSETVSIAPRLEAQVGGLAIGEAGVSGDPVEGVQASPSAVLFEAGSQLSPAFIKESGEPSPVRDAHPSEAQAPQVVLAKLFERSRPLQGMGLEMAAVEPNWALRSGGHSREHWSPIFPLAASGATLGASGALGTLPQAAAWATPAFAAQAAPVAWTGSILGSALGVASIAALIVGGAFAALAALEIGLLTYAVRKGRKVTDDDFETFKRKGVEEGWLDPGLLSLVKPFRPGSWFSALWSGFGYSERGTLRIRRELVATPWLFKAVLAHEISHFGGRSRAGLWSTVASELGARASQVRPTQALQAARLSILERVLRDTKLSLKVPYEFSLLVANPAPGEWSDPKTYAKASNGKAQVEFWRPSENPGQSRFSGTQETQGPTPFLKHLGSRKPGALRGLVLSGAKDLVPVRDSLEWKKLEMAFKTLDELYILSRKFELTGRQGFAPGTREYEQVTRLQNMAGSVFRQRSASGRYFAGMLEDLWRGLAMSRLQDIAIAETVGKLYASLQHKGWLIIPFGAEDHGLEVVEKLLKYWAASDGGKFEVSRVDLPEGGHALVARKIEPRVHLWLKPLNQAQVSEAVSNAWVDPDKRKKVLKVLSELGFESLLESFESVGVEVKHTSQLLNRVFISVPRRNAYLFEGLAEKSGIHYERARGGFTLHLIESVPIQKVDRAWRLQVRGEGGLILDVDTGLDTSHPDFEGKVLEVLDMVNEGPEDWIGHGSHKAGIEYANGKEYKGSAPEATGIMGKVFSRFGFGAMDGDILAVMEEGLKRGADVESLSLGAPGGPESPLAEAASKLTQRPNAKGHKMIVTASFGNAGPGDQTGSSPATGEDVDAVAAATKSLDDGQPEIAFYSSAGPVLDRRYSVRRWLMKPDITGIGGDVTTRPGSTNVFEHGVYSVKSKDSEKSPSDRPDGLHTGMSGTSMSNPIVAGIKLLAKQMALKVAQAKTKAYEYLMEHLPFAMRAVILRSADDMGVPVFRQGPGLVNAEEAVKLSAASFATSAVRPLAWLRLKVMDGVSTEGFDWIARLKAVRDAEKEVYDASQSARNETKSKFVARIQQGEELSPWEVGNEVGKATRDAFESKRKEAVPKLLTWLKDSVWAVRFAAAFSLMNLQAPEAMMALGEAAMMDTDARVRQVSLLAMAETPNRQTDALLKKLTEHPDWVRGVYSAYALFRHGDSSGLARIHSEVKNPEKSARYSSIWLLGQLEKKSDVAAATALADRLADTSERGTNQHLAAQMLSNVVQGNPETVTDEVFLKALSATGPQNLALTRTASRFFQSAARRQAIVQRMKQEPLRTPLTEFVHANKAWVRRPGALGELVSLFARILEIPLGAVSPVPNPEGVGVPGVDPNLGSVDVIVELPKGRQVSRFLDLREPFRTQHAAELGVAPDQLESTVLREVGIDPEVTQRAGAQLQTTYPTFNGLWFTVPDHKVTSLQQTLGAQGFKLERATPVYRQIHESAPLSGMPELWAKGLTGKGVLVAVVDEGGDTEFPGLSKDRIVATRNFSREGGPTETRDESIGHGTHVMGIIGTKPVEGSPYQGMAPDVKFAIVKVLGANGGTSAAVMAGMEFAGTLVENPRKTPVLINMSLGGPGAKKSPMNLLLNKLALKDIYSIVAAGNSGRGSVGSPANAALAISVGSLEKSGKVAWYSSWDPKEVLVTLMTIGGAVNFSNPNPYEIVSALSTFIADRVKDAPGTVKWNGKPLYQYMSGTSMATPDEMGKFSDHMQKMLEALTQALGELPHGFGFWLLERIKEAAEPMSQYPREQVGAGRHDAPKTDRVLDEKLKDPQRVKTESEELAKKAEERAR